MCAYKFHVDALYSSILDCTENNAITCANTRAWQRVAGECIVLQHSWLHREQFVNTTACSDVAGECIVLRHFWLHRGQCNHLCKYQSLPRHSTWIHWTPEFQNVQRTMQSPRCKYQSLSRCRSWIYCTPAFLTTQRTLQPPIQIPELGQV